MRLHSPHRARNWPKKWKHHHCAELLSGRVRLRVIRLSVNNQHEAIENQTSTFFIFLEEPRGVSEGGVEFLFQASIFSVLLLDQQSRHMLRREICGVRQRCKQFLPLCGECLTFREGFSQIHIYSVSSLFLLLASCFPPTYCNTLYNLTVAPLIPHQASFFHF